MSQFDGAVVTSTRSTASTQTLLSITTTLSNSLVVLIAYSELNTGASPTITGVAGGSLTWTKRKSSNGSTHGNLEVWWAIAATPLTAATITATYSANFDDASLCGFAVNGVNTSTPWDSNASLPANQSFITSIAPSFSSISTTSTDSIVLFAVGTADNWTAVPGTPPTGFTIRASTANSGGSKFADFALAAAIETAAVSSATIAWGSTIPAISNTGGEAILDAIALTSAFITFAQVTQVGMEQWAVGSPAVQATLVGIEMWAKVSSVNTEAVVTQVGMEMWASVANVTPVSTGQQTQVFIAT